MYKGNVSAEVVLRKSYGQAYKCRNGKRTRSSNSEAGAKEEEWLVIPNVIFIRAQDAVNAAKCATNSILKLVFTHFVAVEVYGRRFAGFLRWQHSEDIM